MKRPRTETESVPLVPLDATARKVKKLRFVPLVEWFREPRDERAGKEFYTVLHVAFFRAYEPRGIQLSRHNVLDYRKLSCAAGGAQIEPHFTYLRGLAELLSRSGRYVARWVRIFYAKVWIDPNRDFIQFMFRGRARSISREEIAVALGVDLNDTRLHELAYPGAEPPRRACVGGVLPSCARVAMCYRQPFLPESSRAPQRLTTKAMVVHNTLQRSLLPRMGGGEAVTSIQ